MPAQSLCITTPIAVSGADGRICPKCRTANEPAALERRDYRCAGCGLELAHLDLAANGVVRGVFGWLLNPGTLVRERYQVVDVLGRGGFGVTYLVDDLHLAGKRRALKEIPGLLSDEYETRLLGRLNHPAIPDIIDRFEVNGMVYLVLQFGGSRTLRIEMERHGGRIPLLLLLPWIEQVCAALRYLHSQDPPIIHRDLKPENILLDEHERVMLIDFGIAKETAGDNMTRTLGRAATHGFSPPEQVLGTGTDARSDVYALGAILYCTLTGRLPPAAHERITGTVLEPPSRWLPEIPPLLDAAIVQALELNLQKRQQSIAELAHCLELVRSGGASARTVVAVGSSALTAGPPTAAAVRLTGVEFPSLRQSQRTPPEPRVDEQRPVEPRPWPPPGVWAWVGMALAGAILVGGGGWLYRPAADRGPAGGPTNLVAPGSATPLSAKRDADIAPPAATAPVGLFPPSGATAAAAAVAAVEPPPPEPSPVQAPPQVQQPSAVSASIANPEVPGQTVSLPPQASPQPTELARGGQPFVSPVDPKPAAIAEPLPRGSLMTEYETQLAKQDQTAPAPTGNPRAKPASRSKRPSAQRAESPRTWARNKGSRRPPRARAKSSLGTAQQRAIDEFNRMGR